MQFEFQYKVALQRATLVSCGVAKARSFILYWAPVVVWMMLIFTASGDTGSFQRSSRIIGPLLDYFFPHLTHETRDYVVFLVRKCAHLTEYAILAYLVLRIQRRARWSEKRPWRWPQAGVALWVAVFYATTDEFHQTFVASREGCVRDVVIDSSGAVIGLFAIWALGRLFKRW